MPSVYNSYVMQLYIESGLIVNFNKVSGHFMHYIFYTGEQILNLHVFATSSLEINAG